MLLAETDRLFSCSFCRVRLFISVTDHFRYLLTPPAEIAEPLIFVPYWRMKGIVFTLDNSQIESRIVDSSLLAAKALGMPPSLGVRPQVLKLRYPAPDIPGTFLKPAHSFRMLALGDSVSPVPPARQAQANAHSNDFFIGEVVSLIYTPVYTRNGALFDAILRKPVSSFIPVPLKSALAAPEALQPDSRSTCSGSDLGGHISFLPTLCPRCGWDLEGDRDSLVLMCRNCNSLWQAGSEGMKALDFSFMPMDGESSICLPFWRLRAKVTGLPLDSFADLTRLANLPPAVLGSHKDAELHFWVPAFKSHPNLFLRLSRSMTVFQPEPDTDSQPAKSPLFPVTLPLSEALESIKVLIGSMAVPRRLILPRIPALTVSLENYSLVNLPFTEKGEEYIQPKFQMSIQKNALKWGRLI